MSEEILPNEDKETLRRRLEQLKQEYERTAQRLQRAEHHDAIRRQRVSDQSGLTQNDSSQISELSSLTSSVLTSEYSDNYQNLQIQTNRNSSGFSAVQKIPAIQSHLADITSTPPVYSPASKRSPAHRLRSKRSRLRLQNKERESDIDISQEKERDGSGDNIVEREIKNNILQTVSNHLDVACSQEKPNVPLIDWPVEEKLQLGSALSTQTSLYSQSPEAVQLTDKSEEMLKQTNLSLTDSNKVDRIDTCKHSLSSGILDSCTLVEGLPFPVEYYVRTTRRMAASHSSIDLDAVIYSQLSGGRGRRRLSQSQTNSRSHMTPERSEPVCKSTDWVRGRGRGRGRRGKRGRRRSTVGTTSCAKAALDCTMSHPAVDSQADSEKMSEPHTESPNQSELALKGPQVESQPIQLPGSTVSLKPSPKQGVTEDFKHLPNSQLYFDSQLLPDSNLYPIFRRKNDETGRQSQTGTNKEDQSHLLPSLASLIQALREKDTKTGLQMAVEIRDFHLPDDDFGQLKLQRLHVSTSVIEPFAQHPLVYNTRQSSRRQRASGRKSNCEARYSVGEQFTSEPITTSPLEDSLPLCQSETQKDLHAVNEIKTISPDLMESRQSGKTEPDKRINTEKTVEASLESSENIKIEPQTHMQEDTHMLLENTSLCPVILNLSPSLTAHTQKGQDPILPSLGMSPHFLTPSSPLDLRSPLFSSSGIPKSPSLVRLLGCVSPESVSPKTPGKIKNSTSTNADQIEADRNPHADQTVAREGSRTETQTINCVKLSTLPQNNSALGCEHLNHPETPKRESSCISESELECKRGFDSESNPENGNNTNCTPENEAQLNNIPEPESFNTVSVPATELNIKIQTQSNAKMEVQYCEHFETQNSVVMNVKPFHCGNESGAEDQTPIKNACLDTSTTSVLQEMHTFKALEGGCVLDLCQVKWPSEDWCICVAGEWSVCLWAQKKGVPLWSLLHTWTFAQSVMTLQPIPDCLGMLCVTLGHLEITEARVLSCSTMDGPFSQNVVCNDSLQAVIGVSNCRLVFCSTPGDQQKVSVLTLTQEGRVANTLPLVTAKQSIRTLAAVEGEKDALIGWTECKTILIWNMKSGQLLQSICLEKTSTMTNCMKGYSHRGVLCVLLQIAGNVCDEKSNKSLFTLIATNPLTGKHIPLTSISYPDQCKQLIDGDVLGSGLVGVFQSGHLAVWDLRGSLTKVVGVLDEMCRLARWAGPDTLLTGYLNGDVSVFHYKST